ncbi:MAG: DUF1810 domain-containing protein [Clostridiales bacterium]|nr:DUF1810 domain-containing protein [Clostridiales bacterium]
MKKYNLDRFIKAQKGSYETALSEIKNGRKRGHWIWYIFPQLKGLGMSGMSDYYGIADLEEAQEYMENETLRSHLIEISEALLCLEKQNIEDIMGYPDDLKLRSCMTLFQATSPDIYVFKKVLDKYYGGKPDETTISILNTRKSSGA